MLALSLLLVGVVEYLNCQTMYQTKREILCRIIFLVDDNYEFLFCLITVARIEPICDVVIFLYSRVPFMSSFLLDISSIPWLEIIGQ